MKNAKEEEFGSKLQLIDPPGVTSPAFPTDWAVNKKGVKTRVFTVNFEPGAYEEEYPLLLSLPKPIELKFIRFGVQTYTPDFADKVLGMP